MSAPEPDKAAQVRFEEMTEEHLDTVLAIEGEAYPEPWTRGMFQDEIRNRLSYIYLARREEEVVGYCGFWLVLEEAHITTVVVEKNHRGTGVGRRFMEFLLGKAREAGARYATLEVRVSNTPARRLYETFGFYEVAVRPKYYPITKEDAVVMLKELV
ncbi:MAG: ribosomal protein S18-alanine N-acetyltransferase [Candidatus Hydrogenedentota bacterium]